MSLNSFLGFFFAKLKDKRGRFLVSSSTRLKCDPKSCWIRMNFGKMCSNRFHSLDCSAS